MKKSTFFVIPMLGILLTGCVQIKKPSNPDVNPGDTSSALPETTESIPTGSETSQNTETQNSEINTDTSTNTEITDAVIMPNCVATIKELERSYKGQPHIGSLHVEMGSEMMQGSLKQCYSATLSETYLKNGLLINRSENMTVKDKDGGYAKDQSSYENISSQTVLLKENNTVKAWIDASETHLGGPKPSHHNGELTNGNYKYVKENIDPNIYNEIKYNLANNKWSDNFLNPTELISDLYTKFNESNDSNKKLIIKKFEDGWKLDSSVPMNMYGQKAVMDYDLLFKNGYLESACVDTTMFDDQNNKVGFNRSTVNQNVDPNPHDYDIDLTDYTPVTIKELKDTDLANRVGYSHFRGAYQDRRNGKFSLQDFRSSITKAKEDAENNKEILNKGIHSFGKALVINEKRSQNPNDLSLQGFNSQNLWQDVYIANDGYYDATTSSQLIKSTDDAGKQTFAVTSLNNIEAFTFNNDKTQGTFIAIKDTNLASVPPAPVVGGYANGKYKYIVTGNDLDDIKYLTKETDFKIINNSRLSFLKEFLTKPNADANAYYDKYMGEYRFEVSANNASITMYVKDGVVTDEYVVSVDDYNRTDKNFMYSYTHYEPISNVKTFTGSIPGIVNMDQANFSYSKLMNNPLIAHGM